MSWNARNVRTHDHGRGVVAAAQVLHEVRMPHEIVDAQPEIRATRQVQHLAGLAVEPDDLALRVEHDHAIRHGRRGPAQLPEQPREPLLVETLATVQADDLRDDVAPEPHRIRRIRDAAVPEPELQLAELPEVPREVQRERAAHADPDVTGEPAQRRSQRQRREDPQRDVDEGAGARSHRFKGAWTRTGSPSRARFE
jgi:hypothetical protein